MNAKDKRIDRSNLLIIAFQLEGLCTALRQSIGCGLPVGPAAFTTLQSLHAAFAAIHTGPSLAVLPRIEPSAAASDILAFAEVLRATVAAFLTPDEVMEKHRAIGFHNEV